MRIKNTLRRVFGIIIMFVVLIAWLKFVVMIGKVDSGSMEPTLPIGTTFYVDKLAYHETSHPVHQEIIVFYAPDERVLYTKRVIGVPGDTVAVRDGRVYLNGSIEPLDEPYLKEIPEKSEEQIFVVPSDSYFLLGDNRNQSEDSRYWRQPFVHQDDIVGRLWFTTSPKFEFITPLPNPFDMSP